MGVWVTAGREDDEIDRRLFGRSSPAKGKRLGIFLGKKGVTMKDLKFKKNTARGGTYFCM